MWNICLKVYFKFFVNFVIYFRAIDILIKKTEKIDIFAVNMKISFLYVVIFIASSYLLLTSATKCDRTPEGSSAAKSPPDGRYRLKIFNDPVRYIPGEVYNSEF